ncbi:galactose-specific lectin nattectin-like [Lycorma delicatula]|uniref:galactose-specific lectin nattectin-like n=1 Tax=Lycorma delicatula TaxID=130591 RepID=UPI003F519E5E
MNQGLRKKYLKTMDMLGINTVVLLLMVNNLKLTASQGTRVDGMDKRRYECPARFVRVGNSCYYLSANMASWRDAHFACADMASQLATLERKWEDRNMRSLLKKPEAARLERWIGGIWDWEQKCWVWGETGKRLKYQGFTRKSRKNGNNEWHCIAMDPMVLYRWKSASCLESKHYICETPLRNIGSKPEDILKKVKKQKKKGKNKGKGKKQKNRKQSITNNNTV